MKNILVFGASTVWGSWDSKGGWVQRTRTYLENKILSKEQRCTLKIYNLGVSGNTTKHLLERFEFETKQRLKKGGETVFIFSIGTNDGVMGLSLEESRKNLEKLAELARKYSDKIIFVGLNSIDESKTNPISWNKNIFYKNKTLEENNNLMKYIAEKEKLIFIDVFNLLDPKDLHDGLHPNDEGHAKIADKVQEVLLKILK